MEQSTLWWILAGCAVGLELLTGTFYLLMLALGLSAGAIAALVGADSTVQILLSAAVGGGAVTALRVIRGQRAAAAPASSNRDVNMDVGETVHVAHWNADGTAGVKYRGAHWTVKAAPGQAPTPGAHTVVEIVGSQLIVAKKV